MKIKRLFNTAMAFMVLPMSLYGCGKAEQESNAELRNWLL